MLKSNPMSDKSGYNIADPLGTYFLTFTIVGWVDVFSRKECKEIIIDALKYCIDHKGLLLHAYVIMESHIHLVASAAEKSKGLSAIIQDFKKHTSKEIIKWVKDSGHESRKDWLLMIFKYHAKYNKRNSEYQVWQQNNQPKELFYAKFALQKVNYIHYNPVKARIVDQPEAYVHSSARNYVGRTDVLLSVELLDFGLG